MSSLWRENKELGLCQSCSRILDPKRQGRARCSGCARRAARAEAARRATIKRLRELLDRDD